MGRWFILAASVGLLVGMPTPSAAYYPGYYNVHQTYVLHYDDNIIVRTKFAPLSAAMANGGPLSSKQLVALLDHPKPGEPRMPGYAAEMSDLGRAPQFVTIYLEKEYTESGGKTVWRKLPPVYGLVHHSRVSQQVLVVYAAYNGHYNNAPTLLIGAQGAVKSGPQYNRGPPLPRVRLKMVYIQSYYTPRTRTR